MVARASPVVAVVAWWGSGRGAVMSEWWRRPPRGLRGALVHPHAWGSPAQAGDSLLWQAWRPWLTMCTRGSRSTRLWPTIACRHSWASARHSAVAALLHGGGGGVLTAAPPRLSLTTSLWSSTAASGGAAAASGCRLAAGTPRPECGSVGGGSGVAPRRATCIGGGGGGGEESRGGRASLWQPPDQ